MNPEPEPPAEHPSAIAHDFSKVTRAAAVKTLFLDRCEHVTTLVGRWRTQPIFLRHLP